MVQLFCKTDFNDLQSRQADTLVIQIRACFKYYLETFIHFISYTYSVK